MVSSIGCTPSGRCNDGKAVASALDVEEAKSLRWE